MKIVTHYLKKFSTWLLPQVCLLCGQLSHRAQDLCEPCLLDLPTSLLACSWCARPMTLKDHSICDVCSQFPPSFDCAYALFLYQFPITKWVMNLKFNHSLIHARLFGELLTSRIQSSWYLNKALPECIIPMPLHPKRLKERGFNQTYEIARPIAKCLKLPLEARYCHRIKKTLAQATLTAQERIQNIKNAFLINPNLPYQHVAVLDDVITTGQTMNEFCSALKTAGVKRIDVWVCARPLLKM